MNLRQALFSNILSILHDPFLAPLDHRPGKIGRKFPAPTPMDIEDHPGIQALGINWNVNEILYIAMVTAWPLITLNKLVLR